MTKVEQEAACLGTQCAEVAIEAAGSGIFDEDGRCLLSPEPLDGDWDLYDTKFTGATNLRKAFTEAYEARIAALYADARAGRLSVPLMVTTADPKLSWAERTLAAAKIVTVRKGTSWKGTPILQVQEFERDLALELLASKLGVSVEQMLNMADDDAVFKP